MMTNEAPDRIWIDAWGGNWSPVSGGTQEIEYIRKDAACVEVKDKVLYQAMNDGYGRYEDFKRDVLMALTTRTVKDVQWEERELIAAYIDMVPSELPYRQEHSDAIRSGKYLNHHTMQDRFDTPAPSCETQLCPDCGISDDGIGCGCDYGLQTQPTPSPDPEPVAWQQRLESGSWGTIFHGQEKPIWGEARPLYASPPTPASHAEELRKAKEDAWDEGYQWAYDGMSQRNPYRRSTDEG